jgi:hypothetical protein
MDKIANPLDKAVVLWLAREKRSSFFGRRVKSLITLTTGQSKPVQLRRLGVRRLLETPSKFISFVLILKTEEDSMAPRYSA